jgi:ABC-2 type transport system permease protein
VSALAVLPVGARRGWIEFRNSVTNPADLSYNLVGFAVFAVSLFLQRNRDVDGLPIAFLILPGALTVIVLLVTTFATASTVTADREDGGLLRAATVPHGVRAYLTGHVVRGWIEASCMLVLYAVAGWLMAPALRSVDALGVLTGAVVLALGILACLPFGIAVGSLFTSSRAVLGWGLLVLGALVAVSGLFFPLPEMARWTQVVGQVLPVYWLGHGVRAAIGADPVMEVGGEFRLWLAVLVLAGWAVLGSVLALLFLRRAARRESGSAVARRQAAAMRRA